MLEGGAEVVDLGADRALYSISVTSELTGVNPQMLRAYEQKGLLTPYRTQGGTRRYSGQDVAKRVGTRGRRRRREMSMPSGSRQATRRHAHPRRSRRHRDRAYRRRV